MWIDRTIKWLLPREDHFFELLEKGSACALECANLMLRACQEPTMAIREATIGQMAESEREADRVIHTVYNALNKTFVTPLDRSDIYTLATELENIADAIHATSIQMVVHSMESLPAGSLELSQYIVDSCKELHEAVSLLRDLSKFNKIRAHCKKVNDFESMGDKLFRSHLGQMFRVEKDAIALIKAKEFLEGLEHTLDVCDDAANALETVVLKNA